MSAAATSKHGVADKGLRRGVIGLFGSTVLGVVQTAPAYSVAVTLGFLVMVVGVHAPAALLLGFVPILCMTVVERTFVEVDPDCGTVFVWVGRALGPRAGWLSAWVGVLATLIGLANFGAVTGRYLFLVIGADDLAGSEVATVLVGCAWIAAATAFAVRGLALSARVQTVLLALGVAVIAVFSVVALVKVAAGDAGPQAIDPSLAWLNPFAIDGASAASAGLLLAIFFFLGWDGSAAVAEESDGEPGATPRRALLWSALALLAFYLVVIVALQAYAGVGDTGIGLANPENAGDVLAVVGGAALGSAFETLMELAVLTSAAACLVAALVPTARAVLAMGAYRAIPAPFARVDARRGSPVVATLVCGAAVATILVVLSVVSNDVLGDSISAIVLLVALYYALLGAACLWAFRGEVSRSTGDLLRKGVAPVVGTAILVWALYRNGRDTLDSDYGLTSLLGVGGVFVIAVVTVLLGIVVMIAWNLREPAYFRGETFTAGYIEAHRPDLVDELGGG